MMFCGLERCSGAGLEHGLTFWLLSPCLRVWAKVSRGSVSLCSLMLVLSGCGSSPSAAVVRAHDDAVACEIAREIVTEIPGEESRDRDARYEAFGQRGACGLVTRHLTGRCIYEPYAFLRRLPAFSEHGRGAARYPCPELERIFERAH